MTYIVLKAPLNSNQPCTVFEILVVNRQFQPIPPVFGAFVRGDPVGI